MVIMNYTTKRQKWNTVPSTNTPHMSPGDMWYTMYPFRRY